MQPEEQFHALKTRLAEVYDLYQVASLLDWDQQTHMPPDDSRGVLQDVHWPCGLIGYFSSYALGNLISAQRWEAINTDIPDLVDQIRRGEFSVWQGWLREKVHQHGAKFEPQELMQRVTGSKIDPAPYLRYLSQKYRVIYGLS